MPAALGEMLQMLYTLHNVTESAAATQKMSAASCTVTQGCIRLEWWEESTAASEQMAAQSD